MKAYLINMHLLVPRSRSSAKIKVKYKGYISQKMAVLGAFVFQQHVLFSFDFSWPFVIHGGIDGFSRMPVFLKVSNNNKAQTVLDAFLEGVQIYGLPHRVRSDKGGENVLVGEHMLSPLPDDKF